MGSEDERRRVILSADEVVAHLSTDLHDWQRLSLMQRVEEMGVCFAGLCTSPWLSGVREAYDLIGLEGLIEQFGGTPNGGGWLDQPYGHVQAFAEIRFARNGIEERNLKQQQAAGKR